MSPVQSSYNLILTTVGSDLLLNVITPAEANEGKRQWVLESLSERESNLSVLMRDYIRSLGERALDSLRRSSAVGQGKLSPELGGIHAWLGEGRLIASPQDKHLLLAADTHASRTAAQVLHRFLTERAVAAELVIVPQPRAAGGDDMAHPGRALPADLERWRNDKLPGLIQQGYRIILNLAGGPEWLRESCSSAVSLGEVELLQMNQQRVSS